MTLVIAVWVALLVLAGWTGWYFRGRRAVRRGESTARAEREAAIKSCATRHRDACAVYQEDAVSEWSKELGREEWRKLDAKLGRKDATTAHRKRAQRDEEQDG